MPSIFLKVCPGCARPSAVDARVCTCGYAFPSREPSSAVSPQDRAREEQLYEQYLRARVEQALEAARVAAHLAEMFPADRQKALTAAELQLAAQTAEAELATQRTRVADAVESRGTSAATHEAA
jgi:hypothetical protein